MDQFVVATMVDFSAQIIDVDVDDVGEPVEGGIRPNVIGDGCPGQYLVWIAHEEFEEGIFPGRKAYFFFLPPHPACSGVHPQISKPGFCPSLLPRPS